METVLWLGNDVPELVLAALVDASYRLLQVASMEEVTAEIGEAAILVVTLEAGSSGTEILKTIRNMNNGIPVIIHDAEGYIDSPVQLLRDGAFYCFSGELIPARVLTVVQEALMHRSTMQIANLANQVKRESWRDAIVGESEAMQRVAAAIRLIAPRRSTVLITGETGTGKEVIAKAIHRASDRANGPMVAVNCSALPESLLEAELFGHAKGAFTGAVAQRIGRFEQASGGTIFLDEIGDLPLETQGKLLRVLQERELERIGSQQTIKVDVRVIAATNVNLAEAVERKTFRGDLYYRLKVVPIHLPPLRLREGDIPLLVHYFIDRLCQREGLQPKCITSGALEHLSAYEWPGNIRQLEHAVEMAIVLSGERTVLGVEDFPLPVKPHESPAIPPLELPSDGFDFERMISHIQRHILSRALDKASGNKSQAAKMLGMKRSTLVSKIKALG